MKKRRLSGARFNLMDNNGCTIACATSDENGLLCFDHLALGKYCLKEVVAPQGYIPCGDIIPIDLTCDSPERTVEVFNKRIEGQITVIKVGD